MKGRFPLSQTQLDMYVEQAMEPDGPLLNMALGFQIDGPVDARRLEQALQSTVAANEALRLVIHRDSELPAQEPVESMPVVLRSLKVRDLDEAWAWAQSDCNVPFRLGEEPLIRCAHLQVSSDVSLFCIVMHHLIGDGGSALLAAKQICAAYDGDIPKRRQGTYRDFIAAELAYRCSDAFARDEAFWLERFASATPATFVREPLTDIAERNVPAWVWSGALSRETFEQLAAQAHRAGGTVFHACLAALSRFVGHLSGSRDLTVGVALGNRDVPAYAHTLGSFASAMPLRIQEEPLTPFDELVQRVVQSVWSAWEHRAYPASELGRRLGILRTGQTRLFDVALSFMQDRELCGVRLGEARISRARILQNHQRRYLLEIWLADFDPRGPVQVVVKSATHCFPRDLTQTLGTRFIRLLNQLALKTDLRRCESSLTTPVERRLQVDLWNRAREDFSRGKCLHEVISEQAARSIDAAAVIQAERRLSYGELECKSNQLARHLMEAGVGPERIIGICGPWSPELVIGVLGVLKAGGAWLLLDPELPGEQLRFILEDATPQLLLGEKRWLERLPQHALRCVCLDTHWQQIAQHGGHALSPVRARARNAACLIYTRASNEALTGVVLDHTILASCEWAKSAFYSRELHSIGAFASVNRELAILDLLLPLCAGGAITVSANGVAVLGVAQTTTLVNVSPAELTKLLDTNSLPQSVCAVNLVADAPLPGLTERIFRETSVKLVAMLYGSIETGLVSACARFQRSTQVPRIPRGRPISNTQVYVLDENLEPVPIGVSGMLYVAGAALGREYFRQPAMTAARFIANPFARGERMYATQERVRYLPDGELQFVDRSPGRRWEAHPRPQSQARTAHLTPPTAGAERAIQEICESVLDLDHVSLHANLFDIGATSLSLLRIQSLLGSVLGVNIALLDLLANPTVSSLMLHLRAEQSDQREGETVHEC